MVTVGGTGAPAIKSLPHPNEHSIGAHRTSRTWRQQLTYYCGFGRDWQGWLAILELGDCYAANCEKSAMHQEGFATFLEPLPASQAGMCVFSAGETVVKAIKIRIKES